MEHIAREAKVSRTTIYRYFQSRDEVLTALILRTLQELVDDVGERMSKDTSFAEFVVESLAAAVEQVPNTPVFLMLMQETTVVMSRVYIGSEEVLKLVCKYFQPRFEAARAAGELREGIKFEEAMDWIIHVVSSYVMAPSPLSYAMGWREMMRRFLVPAFVHDYTLAAANG